MSGQLNAKARRRKGAKFSRSELIVTVYPVRTLTDTAAFCILHPMPNKLEKSKHHTNNSAYREKLIEHLFEAELLKISWLHHGCSLEVSKPEVDNAGYDLIAEIPGCVRHIQLKTTFRGGKAANQRVNSKLASKPSGCVVWIYFDENTLKLGPFFYFGEAAGFPLRDLSGYKEAKHTKGDSAGNKAKRPQIRMVPKRDFQKLESIEDVFGQLFQADFSKPLTKLTSPRPVSKQPKRTVEPSPAGLFRLIKSVGQKMFVRYYRDFADSNLSNREIAEKLPSELTLKSRISRTGHARSIFKNGLEVEALKLICASERADNKETADAACKLLTAIGKL